MTQINLYRHYRHLLSDFGEIWNKRSTHNAVKHLCPESQSREYHTFIMDVNQITFPACTARPSDILKVNNTLVKSVYRVTESNICILVQYYYYYPPQVKIWPKTPQHQEFTIPVLPEGNLTCHIYCCDIHASHCVLFIYPTTTQKKKSSCHCQELTHNSTTVQL